MTVNNTRIDWELKTQNISHQLNIDLNLQGKTPHLSGIKLIELLDKFFSHE